MAGSHGIRKDTKVSYMEDTIDWQAIEIIDTWLDSKVNIQYREQPLAQDWARVSKIGEELGEAISELILMTGQNPRKPFDPQARERLYGELADTVMSGILALQHFTKNTSTTRQILREKLAKIEARIQH